MSETEEVRSAWGRIVRWLTANAPSTAQALRGPATHEDIAGLREALGFEVPDVLEALLRMNNGSTAKDTTRTLPNGRVVPARHLDSVIFPFGKVFLGCEEIIARRAQLLASAQEAEGYWKPSLIPVIWDFEGAYHGYALDASGASQSRMLTYAEVSPNETDPTVSLGELLTSFADGMDRGMWDVQRPLVENGSLRWRED
ncbi:MULTISPECIES: SMI1/KNR4 family protein [Streptomyces]|uniref:SMI1/KNR4 family protein n=1 Tax=Streptomyces TaxID=1883 RepID=UPI000AF8C2DF